MSKLMLGRGGYAGDLVGHRGEFGIVSTGDGNGSSSGANLLGHRLKIGVMI